MPTLEDAVAAQRRGRQLQPPPGDELDRVHVIFEGANALAASCDDVAVIADARRAAKGLLDLALRIEPGD